MADPPAHRPSPADTGPHVSDAPTADGGRLERIVRRALLAALAIHVLHLAFVAWRLPVDFWDGYEYLMNARELAGHDVGARFGFEYRAVRPPLVPLLLAPLLLGYAPAGGGTSLWAPHLLAVALSALSIAALYWLLRQGCSPLESLLGCAVLCANPLFIHYAPFVMTDIPVMLFLTVAAVAYLQARRTGRWWWHGLAGAALAAAVLAKYTAVFMLGGLAFFEVARVLFPGADRRSVGLARRVRELVTDVRPWLVVAVASALVYLVHAAVLARAVPVPVDTLRYLVAIFGGQMERQGAFPSDPRYEFVSELSAAFSPPLLLIAVLGMLVAARRRTEVDLLCLGWLGVVFAVLTFVVAHKEARYTLPVVPPLVYFVVGGGREVWGAVGRSSRRLLGEARSRGVPALVLLLLAARPLALAAGEVGRFYDPVYAKPFLPEAARWLLARSAPGQPILLSVDTWDPDFMYTFTMYPAHPRFFPHDEYYYFHHIGPVTLAYLLDRPLAGTLPVPPPTGDLASFVERFAKSEVVLGSNGRFIDTNGYAAAVEPPEPITLTFVGRRTLGRAAASTAERVVYEGTGDPRHRLVLARSGGGWDIAEGAPEAGWHVYGRAVDRAPAVRFDPGATGNAPAVLELVSVERVERRFR